MNTVRPSKEAMLICDSIITEVGTNKKSLIGIFEEITTTKVPFRHDALSVYVKFTGAIGQYVFKLELVDLKTNEVIGKGTTAPLNISEKLRSYELVFNLKGLVFKSVGKYEFRISANEEVFGTKTFTLIESEKKPPEGLPRFKEDA
ncbi:MAG: hypothetical protein NC930_02625 [Candidatus Omnitrophica bacterium]|nr:hypothetical protein [Candidatus Omnitrophota bacterium]